MKMKMKRQNEKNSDSEPNFSVLRIQDQPHEEKLVENIEVYNTEIVTLNCLRAAIRAKYH